jgi:hypothetical protein
MLNERREQKWWENREQEGEEKRNTDNKGSR